MCEPETDTKLTTENWDETTQRQYHLEFLNERNDIRAVLYDLLQIDNEIKCTNVEIQNLKKTFDKDLAYLEDEVKRLQDNQYLEPEERMKCITEEVKKIEEANATFSSEIEKYQLLKEKKCQSVSENIEKLFQRKSVFKFTHQKQVETLRRFRLFCDRELRPLVEVRMKSIDRKFCDELFYINSCEKGLKHIFTLIDDRSSRSGLCPSTSSVVEVSDVCQDFLMDFAWMRNEQFVRRTELFDYFKKHLSEDLVGALAALHVHKPEVPIKYVANYLKHLKLNEFRVKRQDDIYAAAKLGEVIYPHKM